MAPLVFVVAALAVAASAEPAEPQYKQLSFGSASCPAGTEIVSQAECEQAIAELGIAYKPLLNPETWVGTVASIPKWCSVRQCGYDSRAHFAGSASGGVGRSDLAPVCKAQAQCIYPGTLVMVDAQEPQYQQLSASDQGTSSVSSVTFPIFIAALSSATAVALAVHNAVLHRRIADLKHGSLLLG